MFFQKSTSTTKNFLHAPLVKVFKGSSSVHPSYNFLSFSYISLLNFLPPYKKLSNTSRHSEYKEGLDDYSIETRNCPEEFIILQDCYLVS